MYFLELHEDSETVRYLELQLGIVGRETLVVVRERLVGKFPPAIFRWEMTTDEGSRLKEIHFWKGKAHVRLRSIFHF